MPTVPSYRVLPQVPVAVSTLELLLPRVQRLALMTITTRAGVDMNTIRTWSGHVSLNTKNICADVDLEMKAKANLAADTRQIAN